MIQKDPLWQGLMLLLEQWEHGLGKPNLGEQTLTMHQCAESLRRVMGLGDSGPGTLTPQERILIDHDGMIMGRCPYCGGTTSQGHKPGPPRCPWIIHSQRLARVEHLLNGLLARIHRDGGHHTGKVGLEQSCADADTRIVEWLSIVDEYATNEKGKG